MKTWVWMDACRGDLVCKRCGETVPFCPRPLRVDTAVAMSRGFEEVHLKCRPLELEDEESWLGCWWDPGHNNDRQLVEIVDFDYVKDPAQPTATVTIQVIGEPFPRTARIGDLVGITDGAVAVLRDGSKENGVTISLF